MGALARAMMEERRHRLQPAMVDQLSLFNVVEETSRAPEALTLYQLYQIFSDLLERYAAMAQGHAPPSVPAFSLEVSGELLSALQESDAVFSKTSSFLGVCQHIMAAGKVVENLQLNAQDVRPLISFIQSLFALENQYASVFESSLPLDMIQKAYNDLWFGESLDSSFSSGSDIESTLKSPILLSTFVEREAIPPSQWGRLALQPKTSIFTPEEFLKLSPSSLKTYVDCPRKFFYHYVLLLWPEQTQAASMGTLIHRLMEVFNQSFGQQPYTEESLKGLAKRLFDYEFNRSALVQEGFNSEDIERLEGLDPVGRDELKERLLAAIEDLGRKGYFQQSIQSILSEKELSLTLLGEERCQFKARIDALIQREDGLWDIIDYKFYRPDKFALKNPEKLPERLLSVFEPLPEGELPHGERFKISEAKPRDYQLPLYYFASQQEEVFQGKIHEVALQIIRPQFPDVPQQGSVRVAISPDMIETYRDTFFQDLKRYVVNPIVEASVFEMNPGRQCQLCDYAMLCESKGSLSLEQEE